MKVLCPIPGCRKRIAVSRFDYLLSHTENTAIHGEGIVPDICKFDECEVTVSDYVDIEAFYREHYLPCHYNLTFSRIGRKKRRSETGSEAASNIYGFNDNCCPNHSSEIQSSANSSNQRRNSLDAIENQEMDAFNFAAPKNSFTMKEQSIRTILREELADLLIPQTLTLTQMWEGIGEVREDIGQIREGIGQLIHTVSENRVQNSFNPAVLTSDKGKYVTVKKENQSSSKQLRMLPLLKAIIPPNQQFRTADNIIQHVATMRGLLVSDEQKSILRDFANRHGLTEDDTLHKCGEYWINRAKNWKQWAEGAAVKPEFMRLSSSAGKKKVNMEFAHAGIENNCSCPGTLEAVNALSVHDPFRQSTSVNGSDRSRNLICPNAALAPQNIYM
ncbi:hypothetical protein BKA69DRAFT_1163592 [Paraphysoderma sedebokerense]|nr:hypothetical protein BKA69DRAFT_1163592 [Paraphysoderma sedebokerense]